MVHYLRRLGAVKKVKEAGKPKYAITDEGKNMYAEWKTKFEEAFKIITQP